MAKKRTVSISTELKRSQKALRIACDPEVLRLFRQAEDFACAADLVREFWQSRCLTADTDRHLGFSSAVVNSAFAVELSLKCLLLLESTRAKSHDLLALFDRLKPVTKKRIATAFAEECHNNSRLLQTVQLLINLDKPPSRFVKPTLRNILKQSAKAFEKWRYIHEGDHANPYVAYCLLSAIRSVILEKHPEWGCSLNAALTSPAQ